MSCGWCKGLRNQITDMGRHAETINQSKIKNFNDFHTIFDFNGKEKQICQWRKN